MYGWGWSREELMASLVVISDFAYGWGCIHSYTRRLQALTATPVVYAFANMKNPDAMPAALPSPVSASCKHQASSPDLVL